MDKESLNKVIYLSLDDIRPNPYQPRKYFTEESLIELSGSIKSYGVIQPISVRRTTDDKYELIAGERRLRASEIAGLKSIPAICIDMSNEDTAVVALVENLQREDLNFIEEAEGYYNLINNYDFTQQELAEKIGKNQSTIANKLRILKLSDEIKVKLLENKLTERHGRALLKLPTDEVRVKVLDMIIKRGLNVKNSERLIKDTIESINEEPQITRQKFKSSLNFRIYLNTLKNAYNAIKDTGIDAEYKQVDKGDFIEVVVKIPKKSS